MKKKRGRPKKERYRERFNICCSAVNKEIIDQLLAEHRNKSKFIVSAIEEAIAHQETGIIDEPSRHSSYSRLQISCSPEQKERIDDYCDRYIDRYKRSKWIVKILLDKC